MKNESERKIEKVRLKDILRVTDCKRKIAEMWRVVFDHFPPVWLCQKKLPPDRRMDASRNIGKKKYQKENGLTMIKYPIQISFPGRNMGGCRDWKGAHRGGGRLERGLPRGWETGKGLTQGFITEKISERERVDDDKIPIPDFFSGEKYGRV